MWLDFRLGKLGTEYLREFPESSLLSVLPFRPLTTSFLNFFFFPGASFLSPIDCKKLFFSNGFFIIALNAWHSFKYLSFPYTFFFSVFIYIFFSCHYFSSNEDCQVNLGIHGLWKNSKLYSPFFYYYYLLSIMNLK